MPRRSVCLSNNETYHVFNRSIAKFQILNLPTFQERMQQLIQYYQIAQLPQKFSRYVETDPVKELGFERAFHSDLSQQEKLVDVIAYCLMPTHIHLVIKQLKDNGIKIFMVNVMSGFSHYFNLKSRRRGPLWEGRFKNVRVESDEQLIHLTRYIHLNPVSAKLVRKPDEWSPSSYKEYVSDMPVQQQICRAKEILNIYNMHRQDYEQFVHEHLETQRELETIKHLIMD